MYRSLLYVPAHAERFIGKAHERGADAIILDLEDAVPEADKDAARAGLGRSVERVGQAGAAVLVRINAGARALDDAKAALAAKAVAIVVAKAEPAGLAELASVGMPLIAMLESPATILDARACAAHPGVIGLMVGGEDLATELGAQPTPEVLRVPKLLAKQAQVVDCGTIETEADADLWVKTRAARDKINLDPAAVRALIERA